MSPFALAFFAMVAPTATLEVANASDVDGAPPVTNVAEVADVAEPEAIDLESLPPMPAAPSLSQAPHIDVAASQNPSPDALPVSVPVHCVHDATALPIVDDDVR